MEYTRELFESKVSRFGEVFVVLDSDREYQIHGSESYEFLDTDEVYVEGVDSESGEYVIAEFPLDSIEHVYTHREV